MARRYGAWKLGDREVLTGSIMAAIPSRAPAYFRSIFNAVTNDYGNVTERTIYRGIEDLVSRGLLIKRDVGLPFAVYLRPDLTLTRAPAEYLHELMLDLVEVKAATSNKHIQRAELPPPSSSPALTLHWAP